MVETLLEMYAILIGEIDGDFDVTQCHTRDVLEPTTDTRTELTISISLHLQNIHTVSLH